VVAVLTATVLLVLVAVEGMSVTVDVALTVLAVPLYVTVVVAVTVVAVPLVCVAVVVVAAS
jgi:hypothetical protein